MDRLKMLEELSTVIGVPGYESEVREVIKKYLPKKAEIVEDRLGSIVCKIEGKNTKPKIMFPAHMDEIGFMVRYITNEGFIKFLPLGGWFDQVLLSQRVIIKTKNGKVYGLIGSKPPHLIPQEERDKLIKKKDMFIDIGAKSKDEVLEMGVNLGDPIVPDSCFMKFNKENLLLGKAWDDRVGIALFLDLMNEIQDSEHPNTVFGVGTVQEEVGLRGATTSVRLVNPDICIVLEVAIAGDTPNVKEEECQVKLGKGPALLIYDARMIPNLKLRDLFIEIAKEEGIPLQIDALEGGATDGGVIHIHDIGVPTVVLGVPTRYIHSHQGFFDLNDYLNTLKLIKSFVLKFDEKKLEEILY